MGFQQITPEAAAGLLVFLYLAGVATRVIWPYALAYFNKGVGFNWRMITGQILAAVVGLFGVLAADNFIADLGLVGYFGAFVLGFGAAAVGRSGQKTVDLVSGK